MQTEGVQSGPNTSGLSKGEPLPHGLSIRSTLIMKCVSMTGLI